MTYILNFILNIYLTLFESFSIDRAEETTFSTPSEIDRLRFWLIMLSELINIYSPRNHQKSYGFLMILGGIEVNLLKFV